MLWMVTWQKSTLLMVCNLDASYFGFTEFQTGLWRPKGYFGSYNTNGFRLDFSDNSATTAITLGKDRSGQGNDFTPNNFSSIVLELVMILLLIHLQILSALLIHLQKIVILHSQ